LVIGLSRVNGVKVRLKKEKRLQIPRNVIPKLDAMLKDAKIDGELMSSWK
jgi:hypothetical protein